MDKYPNPPHPRAAVFEGYDGPTQIGEIESDETGAIAFEVHCYKYDMGRDEDRWTTTTYLTSSDRDGLWIGQNYAGQQVEGTTQFRLPADPAKARRGLRRYFEHKAD